MFALWDDEDGLLRQVILVSLEIFNEGLGLLFLLFIA